MSETSDDSPGFLDRMATVEETFPKLIQTMELIGRDIEHIGQVMQEGVADIQRGDKQAKGFAVRLLVARKVARLLSEPAERIWSFGNEFASQFHEIDQGIRLLIERFHGRTSAESGVKEFSVWFFRRSPHNVRKGQCGSKFNPRND